MNTEKIIITLFAKDRPGIIRELSDTVLANKGNWLESSLSRLCGQFTGIVHIEIADEQKADLLSAFDGLSQTGINVMVQNHQEIDEAAESDSFEAVQILVEANDRAGIIEEIATALADEDVNIENMDSECESASMAGYNLFRAHMFLALPEGMTEEQLEGVLENVSDDLMVSVLVDE